MKILLALSAFGACLVAATAFTVGGPRHQLTQRSLASISQFSSPRLGSMALQMDAGEFAQDAINSNDVVVFSKSFCPYCRKTKALFEGLGVDFKVYELNQMDDGADIQDALLEMTGQRSVPNVFIKQQHIGGNDDTQAAAREGKLQEMLGIAA